MLQFENFTHLTFDCYGTLIDWEAGILECIRPLLQRHNINNCDEDIIRLYARYEANDESGEYKKYYEVLTNVMRQIGNALGISFTPEEEKSLPESVGIWKPFPDTVDFLQRAKKRYKLAILSNTDDDMFNQTAKLLKVEFDYIITAQQAGSYKPSLNNFNYSLGKLGIDKSKQLHIAQSIYHDHVPAQKLGISSVHVNRQSILAGTGVAVYAEARADLEVPDLKTLAQIMGI